MGKIDELQAEIRRVQKDMSYSIKAIYGIVAKVRKDTSGKSPTLLIKARPEIGGQREFIGGEDKWIPVGQKVEDVALRFGDIKEGDRVEIRYFGNRPWRGLAYLTMQPNQDASNSGEIQQGSTILYPPGKGGML